MRRARPLLAVLIASVVAVAGCGGTATVRTASISPLSTKSAAPSQSASRVRQMLNPAPLPSSPAVAVPSPSATVHSAPKLAAPVVPSSPAPTSPVPAGHGPAGSFTTTGSDAVALTFDDGPDPKYTMALLDLLKEQDVKATFCVIGNRVKAHPEVIKRIVAEGHTLCNHSWQHLYNLSERDDKYLMWDLQSTNDAIYAAAPNAKIEYFRAPGGFFTRRLVDFASRLDMKPLYWSVDDQCWQTDKYGIGPAMVNHITTMVQRYTKPGGIILSHDGGGKPQTIATYRTLLPWLKAHFQLEALPTSPKRGRDAQYN